MAQRLQDQSDGLPTARRTTVYADVGCGLEKRGLRSGLRRNRGSWRWRHHWSPAEAVGLTLPGRRWRRLPAGTLAARSVCTGGVPPRRQDFGVTHETYVP